MDWGVPAFSHSQKIDQRVVGADAKNSEQFCVGVRNSGQAFDMVSSGILRLIPHLLNPSSFQSGKMCMVREKKFPEFSSRPKSAQTVTYRIYNNFG